MSHYLLVTQMLAKLSPTACWIWYLTFDSYAVVIVVLYFDFTVYFRALFIEKLIIFLQAQPMEKTFVGV